jgi:hypothetical protein
MRDNTKTNKKPFDVEKLKDMFPPNPQHIHAINEMIIGDRVSILFHQLKAI